MTTGLGRRGGRELSVAALAFSRAQCCGGVKQQSASPPLFQ